MLGRSIHFDHADDLQTAFLQANKRMWCCFAPFLCAFSLEPNRVLCIEEISGSVCLTVKRPDGVDLFMPPIPFDQDVLDHVIKQCQSEYNGRVPRILWLDADDAQRLNTDLLDVRQRDADYIYHPKRIVAAKGQVFKDLRKRVRRFEKTYTPTFRVLEAGDIPDCKDLLKHWRRRQGRRHPFLLDWGYTLAALDQFHRWSQNRLKGWCIEIDGQIDAFALVGEMQPELAHFFVAKSDPDLPDLSHFLRWRVYHELSHYRWVNDASDLGLPGLRQFKQKFRPVDMWPVFSAEPKGES